MMNRRVPYYSFLRLDLFLIALFSSGKIFCQHKQIDSLKLILSVAKEDTTKGSLLNKLSNNYQEINDNKNAIHFADLSLTLVQKLKLKKGEGDTRFNPGNYYQNLYNYEDARKNYDSSLFIREETGDKAELPKRIDDLAIITLAMEI